MLSSEDIKKQSESAYRQWAVQWREQAKHHSKHKMKNLMDYQNHGVGRAMLLVANGGSLGKDLETIKKYRDQVDIMACDKSLGVLLKNGISPDFCMVCDANVNYEKYLEPYKDKLQNTVMFINVCANPKWSDNGNWKDIYFFVNKDVLNSELEFCQISGCNNVIPAGTNVSNAMIVFMSQSDNRGRRNFFGYDKYLLSGFDYCWLPNGNYYSDDYEANGKRFYMNHITGLTASNKLCFTSSNLLFSAKSIDDYVRIFKLPVIQCNKDSTFGALYQGELEEQMQYNYKTDDRLIVGTLLREKQELSVRLKNIESRLVNIGHDHFMNVLATV